MILARAAISAIGCFICVCACSSPSPSVMAGASGASPSAGSHPGGAASVGGASSVGGAPDVDNSAGRDNAGSAGQPNPSAGSGGVSGASAGGSGSGMRPFPQHRLGTFCTYPTKPDDSVVQSAYRDWKDTTVTAEGAGGFLRVRKPDSGSVVGSTVSEGIGYGMILAAYMGDQPLFDGLWRYEQLHLDANGLMNWEIAPSGEITSGGMGGATDGDVDMAWALIMADRQWGGQGSLDKPYLGYAKALIQSIWTNEVDHTRSELLKPGDQWGDVDVTNPSYFAPAYFRVFGSVSGDASNWNKVIDSNYAILARSLNATNGNTTNGLVPAWCDSTGKPVEAFSGAPTHFQNDATRVPFRVGQDYCFNGEPRAKTYLSLIANFYGMIGESNIVDGYALDGTPRPERATGGLQAASFVGPAGVAAMSDAKYRAFLDQAYTALATQKLSAGTIYYQKSWTALSLLMLTGNLVDLSAP